MIRKQHAGDSKTHRPGRSVTVGDAVVDMAFRLAVAAWRQWTGATLPVLDDGNRDATLGYTDQCDSLRMVSLVFALSVKACAVSAGDHDYGDRGGAVHQILDQNAGAGAAALCALA